MLQTPLAKEFQLSSSGWRIFSILVPSLWNIVPKKNMKAFERKVGDIGSPETMPLQTNRSAVLLNQEKDWIDWKIERLNSVANPLCPFPKMEVYFSHRISMFHKWDIKENGHLLWSNSFSQNWDTIHVSVREVDLNLSYITNPSVFTLILICIFLSYHLNIFFFLSFSAPAIAIASKQLAHGRVLKDIQNEFAVSTLSLSWFNITNHLL